MDLAYHRYGGGVADVLSLPFQEGWGLLQFAQDAEKEERLFHRWAAMYQGVMGFDEFQDKVATAAGAGAGEDGDGRTVGDILGMVREIVG